MSGLRPSLYQLEESMKDPSSVRNVCILAHVDHGKTTVADSLLATNRIVSRRMAGSLRYLDDRRDEQERQITMKSSAVSLLNTVHDEDDNSEHPLLLNVIDTPGHIDFSSEVTAAVRVCDGALILVDIVEGVCAQTRESIKQAYEQRVKMILLINKLDRFFTFLMRSSEDVYQSILHVIEDCNAIIAELYQYDDNEVDIEDTGLLFSPETGNVIFASATDGWGFTTRQIASMFINMISSETVQTLDSKIWNADNYVDSKLKIIKPGAIDNKKPNLFVQLCLKTIEYVYNTIVIRMEKDKLKLILDKLKIKSVTRDMSHNDAKIQIRAILEAWKPLADTILSQCLKVIPPPTKICLNKIEYLLNQNYFCENQYLNNCIQNLTPFLQNCSNGNDAPVILYVSKMFCISRRNLSQNKPRVFIPSKPRNIEAGKTLNIEAGKTSHIEAGKTSHIEAEKIGTLQVTFDKKENVENPDQNENVKVNDALKNNDIVTVALARIFTGTIKIGQELYVLGTQYTPDKDCLEKDEAAFINNNQYVKKVTVTELYMLSGRELTFVEAIPAGNICAVRGFESAIIRTATVSSTLLCVPFVEQHPQEPVVRNAIEPVNPNDLPILRHGLKLLMQSDSCVQVITQETGEHVLLTAGDVHLEKCLEDLTTKFAIVPINVSSPMVSLRETIVHSSKRYDFREDVINTIEVEIGPFLISVVAVSLPEEIVKIMKQNYELLKTVEAHEVATVAGKEPQAELDMSQLRISMEKKFKSSIFNHSLMRVKDHLKKAFNSENNHWNNLENSIWSVGKMHDSINLLINNTSNYRGGNIFYTSEQCDIRDNYDYCIVNAFNNTCKSGPLTEEPLINCAFIIKKYEFNPESSDSETIRRSGQMTANMQLSLKAAFVEAFEKRTVRLMEPIFITEIQVNTSILGKVYTVVNKRHGKVLDAVGMDEQEKTFLVKAQIPVIESVGFANEIRKTTSGQAMPSLRFSHYEIIDGDPFYEPASDDEDEDLNIDSAVRASKLRKELRRRKGLYVSDQVVVHAEKQRTLNKKK